MKTITIPIYEANKNNAQPQRIKTPFTLKSCPICGGEVAMYPGRKIYNKPTVFIRCEKCRLHTSNSSYNNYIFDGKGEGFRYYCEKEAIEDLCRKWNNRVEQ